MRSVRTKEKKITVDIPRSLYEETEQITQQRHMTMSAFVREAMERYLKFIKRRKLEHELEEEYVANAALGDRIHNEFEFVDAEQA
jgi:Arc/MetJ-type ribon-helix-helix transcriptional regulator